MLANFFILGNRYMVDIDRNIVHYRQIDHESDGQRLDNFLLKELKGVPKSHIYRIIRSGEVRVNMQRAKPNLHLKLNDNVRIPPVRTAQPKDITYSNNFATQLLNSIIYEDAKLLVLNKPSGMAVHGGSGVNAGVIEALRELRKDIPYLELVHRLDKETSGCLIIAKKRSALRTLNDELADRQITKTYIALLSKTWSGPKQLQVDVALQKNILKSGERLVTVHKDGKSSKTTFKLLENYPEACMVEVNPKTGRTHQIRVHSAYLGHPIIGDKKYGNDKSVLLKHEKLRLCLHASKLSFTLDGKEYTFQADPDSSFEKIRSALRHERSV